MRSLSYSDAKQEVQAACDAASLALSRVEVVAMQVSDATARDNEEIDMAEQMASFLREGCERIKKSFN